MGAVIVLAAAAVVVFVIVLLCANGVVRRNHVVGMRIPAVLATDETWREGHRAAVLPTAIGAIASVVAAGVCLVTPALRELGPVLLIATLVIPLVWAAVRATRLVG